MYLCGKHVTGYQERRYNTLWVIWEWNVRNVRMVQDLYEGRVALEKYVVKVMSSRGRHNYTKSFLVCNGDGQVDGWDQTGVSVDYDFSRLRKAWRGGGMH